MAPASSGFDGCAPASPQVSSVASALLQNEVTHDHVFVAWLGLAMLCGAEGRLVD